MAGGRRGGLPGAASGGLRVAATAPRCRGGEGCSIYALLRLSTLVGQVTAAVLLLAGGQSITRSRKD